jgi:hypothetical protein
MRPMIAVLFVVSCVAPQAMASQSGGRGAATKPATGACALLTKDLLAAHTPAAKESLKLMFTIPPQEEKAGAGSFCQHGDVMLQVDPFPVANFERLFGKWTPVSGVGDRAYFRDNRGNYAELAVVAGGRMITIQMDVPTGRTAASIQSNTVGLAKAILAKLK